MCLGNEVSSLHNIFKNLGITNKIAYKGYVKKKDNTKTVQAGKKLI